MTNSAPAAATEAIERARAGKDETRDLLLDFLRIPSISTKEEHAGDCRAAADWLAGQLAEAGIEHVAVMETGGHPIVYGDWLHAGDDLPTVLVYGHYDVQPPDPLDEWVTPPFEPTIRDGNIYARGSADDKGQLWIHVAAFKAMLAEGGRLPVNVKVIIEGEEEGGSGHLDGFVADHKELLACDVIVVSDTHMLSADRPSIVASLRGMSYCEIEVRGPDQDLHSGTFGGAIRNPAEALVTLLAACKNDEGHITIPGFYDDVVEPSPEDRRQMIEIGFDEDEFKRDAGVKKTWGEVGWSVYEQIGARPTFEINGIWSGYIEPGAKTVLPSVANAKVSMRLVADQDWERIGNQLEAYLLDLAKGLRGIQSVKVTKLHGGPAALVDTTHPAMTAASRALEATFGVPPVYTREGGSIPVVATFTTELQSPTVLMGFGLPDDRLHSPNEKFALRQLELGVETSIAFWHEYAATVK